MDLRSCVWAREEDGRQEGKRKGNWEEGNVREERRKQGKEAGRKESGCWAGEGEEQCEESMRRGEVGG